MADLQVKRFRDIEFHADMLSARRSDGTELRFTRNERALLVNFVASPGQLLTRARLAEALSRDGTQTGDRNVDFVVNRLRARLGDNARTPRFIATQYGEGYVWIAEPPTDGHEHAFLIIGPVYGMHPPSGLDARVLDALSAELRKSLGSGKAVALKLRWDCNAAAGKVDYFLEASFHAEGAVLHAAFVLRHAPTRNILGAIRAQITESEFLQAATSAAAQIRKVIWSHRALPVSLDVAPSDTPLHLRIHDAAMILGRSPESWRENEAQLIEARSERPDDPMLAIMWGLTLYAKLLMQPMRDKLSVEAWRRTEDEIEDLAFDTLPKVQNHPLLVLAVAKLLMFIGRGHMDLAERLAYEAFEKSTAFAAAFATLGQIRMFQGAIDQALELYDKAIELSERGSEFHTYLLALKCTALLAADDRAGLDRVCTELYALRPLARIQIGFYVTPAHVEWLPPDLDAVLDKFSEEQARRSIEYLYNLLARHFRERNHRRNVMLNLATHMTRRFGLGVVPEEVAELVG